MRMTIVWLVASCAAEDVARQDVLEQSIVGNCTAAEISDLTADPTAATESYELNCNAFLSPDVTIKKRVIIRASNVALSCAGATIDNRAFPTHNPNLDMIEVTRRYEGTNSIRPHDVVISRCTVQGSVRVYGMCMNGQDCEEQRVSSLTPGHTERARERAPTNITLDSMRITANHRIPVYFSPGVTYSTLSNSILDGASVAGAIYLDAESAYNTIESNQFLVDTGREVMSIDGSSNNLILNNYFSSLNEGGIYLYRNCGEDGTARWNTPSYNKIINNVFYYNLYQGPNAAVNIGSRNGSAGYCNEDDHVPYGSGIDDRDLATGNVVAQSQIYVRSPDLMIRASSPSNAPANFYQDPSNAGGLTSHVTREAGCYLPDGYPNPLIVDNGTVDMRHTNGRPFCATMPYRCHNGRFAPSTSQATCTIAPKSFGCTATNSNAGCSGTVTCTGTGARMVGAVAACNLELGSVTTAQLNALAGNTLSVVRASDVVSDGACTFASTTRSSGTAALTVGQPQASFHCHERDSDGGDCNLAGTAYCRTQSSK